MIWVGLALLDPPYTSFLRRRFEHQFSQLFRWMTGHYLELTTVFQELGQPLVDQRLRIAAEGLFYILVQLAAGPPFLAAKEHEQPLGDFLPFRSFGVDV